MNALNLTDRRSTILSRVLDVILSLANEFETADPVKDIELQPAPTENPNGTAD